MTKILYLSLFSLQFFLINCTNKINQDVPEINQPTGSQLLVDEDGYVKIPLTQLNSGHLSLYATLNKVKGHFILDTGASTTVVDRKHRKKFRLITEDSKKIAKTAGGVQLKMEISNENTIKFEQMTLRNFKVSLIDLKYINYSFQKMGIADIDGIIGNDVLKCKMGVIDYGSLILYLKKSE